MIAKGLSYYSGGFVCEIELSGRPIKTNRGMRLAPFKSEFYRVGMSDILFFYKSKVFAFEIKTPKEFDWVGKHYTRLKETPIELLKSKKDIHIAQQIQFIENIIKSGGHGAFICSFDQAKLIIKNALLESD